MKKVLCLLAFFGIILSVAACGGDDSKDPAPAGTAPKAISVTPANGTKDVALGNVHVKVVYSTPSKRVIGADDIKITGTTSTPANLKFSVATLEFDLNCQEEGATIGVNIPQGYVVSNNGAKPSEPVSFSFTMFKKPDLGNDEYESASVAVKNMIAGWNLGNTLDAWATGSTGLNQETCWGQPKTEAFLMKKMKEKGFTAIRVPVTWKDHMDSAGNVDEAWMNRVAEVVNYVLDNDMYCILNVHHDTGADKTAWLKADGTTYAASNAKFKYLWKQIADHFKNYSEKLVFEGYNEMLTGSGDAAQWNTPNNEANLDYINKYAQDFVDAVRSTGGKNKYRNLIVTTYAASPTEKNLQKLVIPTDPCGNQSHLAVEVHTYAPYDWVNTYNKHWTAECTREITNMFALLKKYIMDQGYPVVIGEYGSNGKGEVTINKNSTHEEKLEAGKQASDMTTLCKQYNAAAFYWMGIVDGNDRKESSFKWSMEEVADAIVNAAK